PYAIVALDFNNDANLDLIVTNYFENTFKSLVGYGDGTFKINIDRQTGIDPTSVVIGDFNNDKMVDVATTNTLSNNIGVKLNLCTI
ncbi:unnamed protein product, partial [Adineta steineri]